MSYGNYAPFYRGGYFNPMQTPTIPNMADNQNQWQMQNMQQPMQANPAPMQTQPTNDMIWVLNRNEADSFPVAPNNSVVLWDKNNPTIYVKSVNANGIPSMRVLDFIERNIDTSNATENARKDHACTCGDNFVTKEQFEVLKGEFYSLQAKCDEIMLGQKESAVEKPKTTVKKTKESEE